ncbi:von Willebrand factor A domain-containing protein 3B-like isoform X2 [Babylonia areolata]|uniref:von Willebrand factor A domain-containing protein 3B-like isoform X2 n=1 Tax=Babylonia areolata TaxID=304850 RepID=UPI003FD647E0
MTAVVTKFLSVDPYLKNAFSSGLGNKHSVKFDISHKNGAWDERQQYGVKEAEEHQFSTPSTQWEVEVRTQVSTAKWLHSHGLQKLRLQMGQILEIIGFKLSEDYDPVLKRPVSSQYGQGLFEQITGESGKTFNIACDRDKLLHLRKRLMKAIALYRRRLEWLTTESRRVFGVVEEKAVTVVIDIRNMSPEQFDQYRAALDRVMREQFRHLTKFNLIRAAEDMELYSVECIPCSHGTLDAAIQWVWQLDRLAPVSNTACAEAVLKALLDRHNEAVYLFTEGTSIDCGRELVLEKVSGIECKIPIHVVSFNCNSSDTIKFLRNLATVTGGRFHAYAVMMETDDYEASPSPSDLSVSHANVLLKHRTFGGVGPGAGVRPDVVLLFEEMEQARNNLQQVEVLIDRTPEPNKALTGADRAKAERAETEERDEQHMSSKQWLSVYGIDARKLSLQDVLSSVAFRHQDGVVEVLEKPPDNQTDAVGQEKLINARYCDKFPVVRWKDDQVVHVQVTPEVHRNYEQRMHVALNTIQQRIDWLKQGSRALFGTVVEDEIYILIDTSASMQHSMQFVKERLFILMQEQLRHKSKFNILAFNSKVIGWRDRLTDVNEHSLQSAWKWVQDLTCWGSTNTYAAIQMALSDTHTQAIYLLTDGRPDQTSKSILTQVQMQKRVPIHTISFNCDDNDANQFLSELAHTTDGRYHCYTQHGKAGEQPDAWQSEDIKLLEDEIGRGFEYLDRMLELRNECASLAWKAEIDALKTCPRGEHATPDSQGLDARDLFHSPLPPHHPSTARTPCNKPSPHARTSSAKAFRPSRPQGMPKRPQSAKGHRGRKLVAGRCRTGSVDQHGRGHTRTSLLRTMTSSGRFTPSEWLLPETEQLFDQQSDRHRHLAQLLAALGLAPSVKATDTEVSEKAAKHKKKRLKLTETRAASSKQWLKKYGLIAKRLTILDALSPTLVPHRSTYVPVLDKRVMARVFDEILPIAHVSGRRKIKMTLVNPNAVNLEEYEEKVEKAVAKYRRRLNTIVWDALPESVKEEFDSKEPVSFEENKTKFLLALAEEGWPVTEADIIALEKEIAKGEKYLRQSRDLRRVATEEEADVASEVSAPPSVEECEQEEEEEEAVEETTEQVLQVQDNEIITAPTTPRINSATHTPRPPDARSPRSQDARTPRSLENPATPHTHTPRPPDNTTPRLEGSYNIRISLAKERGNQESGASPRSTDRGKQGRKGSSRDASEQTASREEKGAVSSSKGRVKVSMLRGSRVIARNHADGLYYSGKVVRCPNVRHAVVEFTDGQRDVLTRFILPISGAIACPPLSVGDYALVQVMHVAQSMECYVPCIVQFTPHRRQAHTHFYTVMLYNGQKVTTRRSHLVKISKERFELSARYITDIQGEDRKEVEAKVYVSEKRKTGEDFERRRDHQQRSHSASSRDSRSGSRTRSRSPSSCGLPDTNVPQGETRSRSLTPPSRPRSPTPGDGFRSSHRKSSRRERMNVVGNNDHGRRVKNKQQQAHESPSRTYSDSDSSPRRDSRQQKASSRSPSHSRSRSRSPSASSTPSPNRKPRREPRKRSRSATDSESASPRSLVLSGSLEIVGQQQDSDGTEMFQPIVRPVSERHKEMRRLKKQLKEQQRQQAREQKKLKKKLKKLESQLLKQKEDKEKEEEPPEPEEEEPPIITPRMLRLRRSLPELQPAEEVLARFSDDGWYYRGTVQQNVGDLSYIVEDATGHVERIWREDIISDYDDNAPPLKENDRVVAQHPQFSGSYAPGSMLSFDDVLQMVTVRFYDGTEGPVPRAEVYQLPREKYNHDVLHIQQRQQNMLGLSVVARDDDSGGYFPGQITKITEGGQNYVVRWSDGSQTEQLPVHIFSAVTRRPRLLIGDRVLAVASPDQVLFLPGQIIAGQQGSMVVRFCDGQVRDDVNPLYSYWLSPGYFEEASYFWKINQPDFGKRHIYHA